MDIKRKIGNLSREISMKLQEIEDLLKTSYLSKSFIDIPSGPISYADTHRKRFSFLKCPKLISNVSYHLMLNDLFSWMLHKFNLYSVVKEMLIKIAIANYGNIIAAIVTPIAKRFMKRKKIGFNQACSILVQYKIISSDLKKELRWVYDIRCKQHVDTLNQWEYEEYDLSQYKKTEDIWYKLLNQIKTASNNGLIPD